jgi:UDP-N-acetyl-D-glucosamine dehydrogenase
LFGLAYKSNTSDARESPAVKVAELLLTLGANVLAVDSHVLPSQVPTGVTLVDADPEVICASDAVVILTDHDDVDYAQIAQAPGFVLDTRRRLNGLRDSL